MGSCQHRSEGLKEFLETGQLKSEEWGGGGHWLGDVVDFIPEGEQCYIVEINQRKCGLQRHSGY